MRAVVIAALAFVLFPRNADALSTSGRSPIHYRFDVGVGILSPSNFNALYDDLKVDGVGPSMRVSVGISIWGQTERAGSLLSVAYFRDAFTATAIDELGPVDITTQLYLPTIGGLFSVSGKNNIVYVGARIGYCWIQQDFQGRDVIPGGFSGSTEVFDIISRVNLVRAGGITLGLEGGYMLADAGKLRFKDLGQEYETTSEYDFSGLHVSVVNSLLGNRP